MKELRDPKLSGLRNFGNIASHFLIVEIMKVGH